MAKGRERQICRPRWTGPAYRHKSCPSCLRRGGDAFRDDIPFGEVPVEVGAKSFTGGELGQIAVILDAGSLVLVDLLHCCLLSLGEFHLVRAMLARSRATHKP